MNNTQETQDTEAIEIKTLSLVDATLQTAKASFAELVKESSVDKRAKELKAQLKKAEINGIEDNKGYALVKMISRDASKIRIAIEKRRKELKSDIITAGKNIDALANEYQSLINPIENDADAKLLIIDNAVKEAKEKAEREAKEKLDNRVKELIENGLRFDGFGYSINDINVGIQFIQELPDAEYETFLGKVKIQNELNIAEIKRKDDEAKEFQKIQDQLRLENEKKAKALQEQEDAINAKLKAIEDAEKELERKVKEQQELKEKQEREAKEQADRELLADRAKPFQDLGFIYNFNSSQWSLQIGQKAWTITAHTLLSNEYDFEEIKAQIEVATKAENERLAELENQKILNARYNDRKNELIELGFIQNGENSWFCNDIDFGLSTTDINSMTESYWYEFTNEAKAKWTMHNEKKRLAKLSEQQLFNEYISKIKAIEVPKLTDPMLLGLINKILDVIK